MPKIKKEDLHDTSAEHANDDHERPAGHQSKAKEDIAQSAVQSKLGKIAVERVEGAFIDRASLVACGRVDLYNLLCCSRCDVERDNVDCSDWL